MSILQDRGTVSQAGESLTNVRRLSQYYLTEVTDTESYDAEILLAGIFNRLDTLTSIVEKIKIPRMLL